VHPTFVNVILFALAALKEGVAESRDEPGRDRDIVELEGVK
jgi:hypothetical protein